ncbi:MAG: lytic transglycosylase domain-containing protein [Pseudolabrys sp.]|nr:lytic transglycosylase domain-containing protein [Pseudolabrys sp.]MBV9954203.1 lytic transglycosylase domain-containing protein [Pseudolabrys sp.]
MIGALAAPAGADEAADTAEAAKPEPIRLPPRRAIAREVVCETLADAATANNVPTPFFIRLIWRESGFNQNAVSPVGAQGVAQFMPATAAQHRLADPFDPLAALHASARFLRSLINQFGNVGLAAAAYNAGPGRVATWLASKKGKLPQETRDYVQNITGKAPEQWRGAAAAAPIKIPAAAPCQREAGLFAANGPAKIPLPPSIATASVTGKKQAADKSHDKLTTGTVTAAVSKTPGKSSTKTTTKVAQAAPSAHNAPRKPLQLAANKEPAPVKREAARTAAKDDKKRDRPVGKRVKVADAGRDGK